MKLSAILSSDRGVSRLQVRGSSLKLFLDNNLIAFGNDSSLPGPGKIGIRSYATGSAMAKFESFSATKIAPVVTTLPFNDSFAGPGSQLSLSWIETMGNFTVSSGVLRNNSDLSISTLSGFSAADISLATDVVSSGLKTSIEGRRRNQLWRSVIETTPYND